MNNDEAFQNAVTDGFVGACGRVLRGQMPNGATDVRPILWLLVDHILLLAQARVYVTITLLDHTNRVVRRFSSLSVQDRAFWNLPRLSDESVASKDAIAEATFGHTRVLLTLGGAPNALQFERNGQLAQGTRALLEAAGIRVLKALEQLPADHPEAGTARPAPVIEARVWDRQHKLIQTRLDPILRSWCTCDLFPRDRNGLPRLFVALRQPFTDRFWPEATAIRSVQKPGQALPAQYGYSAGLFLTPTQCAERGLTPEELALLVPLGQGARAIGDSPLTSGNIDIGLPGERSRQNPHSREYYGEYPAVAELEDRIYGPEQRTESIFYTPVHIHGVPWLALYSFQKQESSFVEQAAGDLRWQRYSIYRDIAPTIADEASQAIAQAFADGLADVAKDHLAALTDPELFATKVTAVWKELSVASPYGTARLAATPGAGDEHLRLQLPGRSVSFYLAVTGDEPNVSYRMLAPDLLRGLLELRLQAAVESRSQERHSLSGLTVHDWVNKLADGIARSEKLKEAAISAGLDDSIMDHVYGLCGTLSGDIGLPWILYETQFQNRRRVRYFTSRAACEDDVQFLRAHFEFCVRAMLSARRSGPLVQFEFRCDKFPKLDCVRVLEPLGGGIAEVAREIESLLVMQPSPWPLDDVAVTDSTTREGILSALTLAARETLRNAIRHGADEYMVSFKINVSLDRSQIVALVENQVPSGADVAKRLADIRDKCAQLQNAVPFATCSPRYDSEARRFAVECVLEIQRGSHEQI